MMALMYSPSPVLALRYGRVIVVPDSVDPLGIKYLTCGTQKLRRSDTSSTMVSFAPTPLPGLVLRVALSEVGATKVNVDDGVGDGESALVAKRIEERGIFKAHLTQTSVLTLL